MPLSHDVDQNRLVVAMISGAVSAFFHWASVRTSDKPVTARVLQGHLIASFASGVISTQLLAMQTLVKVDPLGAFSVAAVIGFVYGPLALVVMARMLAKRAGFDPPPLPSGSVTPIQEKADAPVVKEVAAAKETP